MTSNPRPSFYLPQNANIPKEWIRRSDLEKMVVVVPSWGGSDAPTHEVTIRLSDRKMFCDELCKGFVYHGHCHHVRGVIWFSTKPRRPRKQGNGGNGGGVADTSLAAYNSMTDQELSPKRRRIYDALRALGPMTNRQLSKVLNWEINRVTGRVNELVNDFALVAKCAVVDDPETGHPNTVWMAVSP